MIGHDYVVAAVPTVFMLEVEGAGKHFSHLRIAQFASAFPLVELREESASLQAFVSTPLDLPNGQVSSAPFLLRESRINPPGFQPGSSLGRPTDSHVQGYRISKTKRDEIGRSVLSPMGQVSPVDSDRRQGVRGDEARLIH